jgi:hypothetical protein
MLLMPFKTFYRGIGVNRFSSVYLQLLKQCWLGCSVRNARLGPDHAQHESFVFTDTKRGPMLPALAVMPQVHNFS